MALVTLAEHTERGDSVLELDAYYVHEHGDGTYAVNVTRWKLTEEQRRPYAPVTYYGERYPTQGLAVLEFCDHAGVTPGEVWRAVEASMVAEGRACWCDRGQGTGR